MAGWRGANAVLGNITQAGDDAVSTTLPYLGSNTVPGDQLPGGWHPTVAYMLGFVIAEIFAYHFLSKHLHII